MRAINQIILQVKRIIYIYFNRPKNTIFNFLNIIIKTNVQKEMKEENFSREFFFLWLLTIEKNIKPLLLPPIFLKTDPTRITISNISKPLKHLIKGGVLERKLFEVIKKHVVSQFLPTLFASGFTYFNLFSSPKNLRPISTNIQDDNFFLFP